EGKLLQLRAPEGEKAQIDAVTCVVLERDDEHPARTSHHFASQDPTLDLHDRAGAHASKRINSRLVFIPKRKVQRQILLAADAEFGEPSAIAHQAGWPTPLIEHQHGLDLELRP